jgi:DNA repair exonuclease SbcCD ATPase subunit
MIEIVEKRINEIKKTSLEENLNKLKKYLTIKKSLINSYEDNEQKNEIVLELTKIKYKIAKIQKELSLNIDFWIFDNLKIFLNENKNGIYFIPYSDFRGRSYTDSKVSPQSN